MTPTKRKPFEEMTIEELESERKFWEDQIASADGWGSWIATVDGFRRECASWIAIRKLAKAIRESEK